MGTHAQVEEALEFPDEKYAENQNKIERHYRNSEMVVASQLKFRKRFILIVTFFLSNSNFLAQPFIIKKLSNHQKCKEVFV